MDDLIERLRRAKLRHESGYMKDVGFLLAEAADALEAMREAPVVSVREAKYMDGHRAGKIIATTDAAMIGQRVRIVKEVAE